MNRNMNERKDITDTKKRIFFCSINRSFNKYLEENNITPDYSIDVAKYSEAIYECAKGAWKVSKKRLPFIEYVFALYQNIVVGIYKVSETSWIHRTQLDNVNYNFPTEPEIREKELQYSIALKNCTNEETDIKRILKNKNLSYEYLYKNIIPPYKFENWNNRYFFEKEDNNIDDDINEFLGKILYFPNHYNSCGKIYRNEHYNFYPNGEIKKYE